MITKEPTVAELADFLVNHQRARALLYTSIDDARSSLQCSEQSGAPDTAVLELAIHLISEMRAGQRRNYKTKLQLFERTLKRWRKLQS